MSRIITVYYSRKGENYWSGSIKNLKKGNTEIVAEFIQKAIGGDLFEVETIKEYAKDYRDCCAEAQKELRENARPELKRYPIGLEEYDVIFVGYPNWWGTMPMACLHCLKNMISRIKKSFRFAPTKVAAWV